MQSQTADYSALTSVITFVRVHDQTPEAGGWLIASTDRGGSYRTFINHLSRVFDDKQAEQKRILSRSMRRIVHGGASPGAGRGLTCDWIHEDSAKYFRFLLWHFWEALPCSALGKSHP